MDSIDRTAHPVQGWLLAECRCAIVRVFVSQGTHAGLPLCSCKRSLTAVQDGGTRARLAQQIGDLREQLTAWSDGPGMQAKLQALERARGMSALGALEAGDAEDEVSSLRTKVRSHLLSRSCGRLPSRGAVRVGKADCQLRQHLPACVSVALRADRLNTTGHGSCIYI